MIHVRFIKILIILCVLSLSGNCSTALVKKEEIHKWNTAHNQKKYKVRSDLFFQRNQEIDKNRLIQKKGTTVALKLESSDDWIRLRLRDITKSEEQFPGEIGYFFVRNPELDETSSQVLDALQSYIKSNLDVVQ